MSTCSCWKNSPRGREGGREGGIGGGRVIFPKMVLILETKIYLWSEEKSSLLTGFSLQRFLVIENTSNKEGGRYGRGMAFSPNNGTNA